MARPQSPRRRAPGTLRPSLTSIAGRVAKLLSSGGGWILSTGRRCACRALDALRRRFARRAARFGAVVEAPSAGSPPRYSCNVARRQGGGEDASSDVGADSSSAAPPRANPNRNQEAQGDADYRLAAPTPAPPTGAENEVHEGDAHTAPDATGMPLLQEGVEGPSSPRGERTDQAAVGEDASSEAGDLSNAASRVIPNLADNCLAAPEVQEHGKEPSTSSSPPRRSSENDVQNAPGEGSSSVFGDAATSAPGTSSPRTHVQQTGGEGLGATAASSANAKGKAPLLEDDHEPPSSPLGRYSKNEVQYALGEGSSSDAGDAATSAPCASSTRTLVQEIGGEGLDAAAASSANAKGKAPFLEDDQEPPSPRDERVGPATASSDQAVLIEVNPAAAGGLRDAPSKSARRKTKQFVQRKKLKIEQQAEAPSQQFIEEDEDSNNDLAKEKSDLEIEGHKRYCNKACRKHYIYCLICFLKGENREIEEKIKHHCNAAHQCDGIQCGKRGCLVRGKTKREIGLHEDACRKIK